MDDCEDYLHPSEGTLYRYDASVGIPVNQGEVLGPYVVGKEEGHASGTPSLLCGGPEGLLPLWEVFGPRFLIVHRSALGLTSRSGLGLLPFILAWWR